MGRGRNIDPFIVFNRYSWRSRGGQYNQIIDNIMSQNSKQSRQIALNYVECVPFCLIVSVTFNVIKRLKINSFFCFLHVSCCHINGILLDTIHTYNMFSIQHSFINVAITCTFRNGNTKRDILDNGLNISFSWIFLLYFPPKTVFLF